MCRFVGGELNTCYNAVDRHVDAGNGDEKAIIFDSPVTDSIQEITYKQLQHQVMLYNTLLGKSSLSTPSYYPPPTKCLGYRNAVRPCFRFSVSPAKMWFP